MTPYGEHKEIMEVINATALQVAVMKEKQENNHLENRCDIKILFNEVKEMKENLPCKIHIEKFKAMDKHMQEGLQWRRMVIGLFVTVLLSAILFSVTWGGILNKVDFQAEENRKIWSHCCEKN